MLRVDVLTTTGTKSEKITLPKKLFGAKINSVLMAQAVRVYLGNQRRAKAKSKTRAEIVGSRRKIWRQKGTGRARHGDRYAPIFVGGGVAHGPTGKENYQRKMSKKMKKQALASALTSRLKDKQVIVVKGLEKVTPKTKKMAAIISKLMKEKKGKRKKGKVLLVLDEKRENLIRAARNIEDLKLISVDLINTYKVLNGGQLIFTKRAIEVLKKTDNKVKKEGRK